MPVVRVGVGRDTGRAKNSIPNCRRLPNFLGAVQTAVRKVPPREGALRRLISLPALACTPADGKGRRGKRDSTYPTFPHVHLGGGGDWPNTPLPQLAKKRTSFLPVVLTIFLGALRPMVDEEGEKEIGRHLGAHKAFFFPTKMGGDSLCISKRKEKEPPFAAVAVAQKCKCRLPRIFFSFTLFICSDSIP